MWLWILTKFTALANLVEAHSLAQCIRWFIAKCASATPSFADCSAASPTSCRENGWWKGTCPLWKRVVICCMIVWWCKHDSEPSNAWRARKCCTFWSLNDSRVLRHGLHKTCMQVSSNKMRVAQLSPEVVLSAVSRTHSLLEADPCAHLHPDCRCDWRLSSKVICQVRCSMLSHVLNSCRRQCGHTVLAEVWLRLGRFSQQV